MIKNIWSMNFLIGYAQYIADFEGKQGAGRVIPCWHFWFLAARNPL